MKLLAFILIFAISLTHSAFAQQPACDYKAEILADGYEFKTQDFKWKMRATKIGGKPTNITGAAEIQDSDGKTVKKYKPWTSQPISQQKTSSEYTPNLKPGEYEITAGINVECNDTNKDNNADAKKIRIIEENKTESNESKDEDIQIKAQSPQENYANGNQTTNQTTKTIQKTTDEEDENTIQLTNKGTQKIQELPPMTSNTIQSPKIVYESSNEKAKGLITIFLLTLSILLNIILIWKR